VLGDLSVVRLTEFGEKFCKAVIGDMSGLYEPPDWARELKPKGEDLHTSVAQGSLCNRMMPCSHLTDRQSAICFSSALVASATASCLVAYETGDRL
jgi:hypothetical protein